MNRSMLSFSTAALLFLSALCNARADEVLKFRSVMHATSAQALDVGDVDGHALGLARVSGLLDRKPRMSFELRSLLPNPNSCLGTSPHQQGRGRKRKMREIGAST